MPWLRTGTVACTLNSTTVTGTGTGFVANARVGDAFLGPDGRWYEVANIASDTALSILPAYLGATVSAGAYALAPMQGYVKDSADQLRTLVNKFGTLAAAASINALAAVTGGANKIAYFTAADQIATADFPAQARTLLAATTQATQRTALGLGSAAVAPVVGTVSQVSGVPTGAIIERGANANGVYEKRADGSMAVWKVISGTYSITSGYGAIFASAGIAPGAMAATFARVDGFQLEIASSDNGTWHGVGQNMTVSAFPTIVLLNPVSASKSVSFYLRADGVWFT
ncbi:MAG: hypothetical protein ACRYF9_25810 [Janthinobacterium lividum]